MRDLTALVRLMDIAPRVEEELLETANLEGVNLVLEVIVLSKHFNSKCGNVA